MKFPNFLKSVTSCFSCSGRGAGLFAPILGALGRFVRAVIQGLVLVSLLMVSSVEAGEISIKNPQILGGEEGYSLTTELSIELGSKLEEALTRGVPLYFIQEFEMSRPRWYWIEDKRFAKTQTVRLYYHALTRQYRIGNGGLHQSFSTLEEALRYLVHARNWPVIEKSEAGTLKAGESYQALFRVHLDSTQLPRPLLISVLFAKDWELSGETRWVYTVTPTSAASPSAVEVK
jgi:hypothetical protein